MRTTTAVPETQCRATLQAELDLGGTLYIPAGRYLLDGALNMSRGELRGDGEATELYSTLGGTVLRIASPATNGKWLFQSSQWSDDCSGATLIVDVQSNWGPDQTFICGSWYNGQPGSWYLLAVAGGTQLAVVWRDLSKAMQIVYFPMQNPFSFTFPSLWKCPTRKFEINDQLIFNHLSLPWIMYNGAGNAYGTRGHAAAVRENMATVGPARISSVRLHSGDSYGQVLSIGSCYDVEIAEIHTFGGAQGIGTLDLGTAYPIRIRDCMLDTPSHCNLYLGDAIATCSGLTLKYPAESAAILKGSCASFKDTFVTDAPAVGDVFSILDNRGNGGVYSFRDIIADFEGGSPQSYWNIERHANTPKTELLIEGAALGKLSGPAQVIMRECELGGAAGPCYSYLSRDLSTQKSASWLV